MLRFLTNVATPHVHCTFRLFPFQVFPQLPLEQPRYEEREARRLSVQRELHPSLHQAAHNLHNQQGYQHNENQTSHQSYPNQQNSRGGGKLNHVSETRGENLGGRQGKEDDREKARREREEWERLEWERVEKERAERKRIDRERGGRVERERIEKERAERERVEIERMEKERVERQRVEREIEERERLDRVQAAREREERIMMEQMEEERAERQRVERQRDGLGPRPSPLGQDSPPVGKAHSLGLRKVRRFVFYFHNINCRWPVGPSKWKRRERWKLHQEGWAQVVVNVQPKLYTVHNFDREGSE